MSPAIALAGLEHGFGDVTVLRGLDLVVEGPGVVGFLGVNGAGKSTTMRILNGFLRPRRGTVRVLGEPVGPDAVAVRRRIGYLPQVPAFHDWMTGSEVMTLAADLSGLDRPAGKARSAALLERLGLAQAAGRRTGGYSGGMRQLLGLAQALLGEPELLLLDEPVSALDPRGRAEVLALLGELGRAATVFVSSHVLADLERVCDRVVILHEGRALKSEQTATLLGGAASTVLLVETGGYEDSFLADLRAQPWALAVECPAPAHLALHPADLDAARRGLPALLARHGVALHRLSTDTPTLEAVFLRAIGGAP